MIASVKGSDGSGTQGQSEYFPLLRRNASRMGQGGLQAGWDFADEKVDKLFENYELLLAESDGLT